MDPTVYFSLRIQSGPSPDTRVISQVTFTNQSGQNVGANPPAVEVKPCCCCLSLHAAAEVVAHTPAAALFWWFFHSDSFLCCESAASAGFCQRAGFSQRPGRQMITSSLNTGQDMNDMTLCASSI